MLPIIGDEIVVKCLSNPGMRCMGKYIGAVPTMSGVQMHLIQTLPGNIVAFSEWKYQPSGSPWIAV